MGKNQNKLVNHPSVQGIQSGAVERLRNQLLHASLGFGANDKFKVDQSMFETGHVFRITRLLAVKPEEKLEINHVDRWSRREVYSYDPKTGTMTLCDQGDEAPPSADKDEDIWLTVSETGTIEFSEKKGTKHNISKDALESALNESSPSLHVGVVTGVGSTLGAVAKKKSSAVNAAAITVDSEAPSPAIIAGNTSAVGSSGAVRSAQTMTGSAEPLDDSVTQATGVISGNIASNGAQGRVRFDAEAQSAALTSGAHPAIATVVGKINAGQKRGQTVVVTPPSDAAVEMKAANAASAKVGNSEVENRELVPSTMIIVPPSVQAVNAASVVMRHSPRYEENASVFKGVGAEFEARDLAARVAALERQEAILDRSRKALIAVFIVAIIILLIVQRATRTGFFHS